MQLTQKDKVPFSFFPLFFFFQWEAASGCQQKLLMRVNILRTNRSPPSLMNFPLKKLFQNFWVPAVITGDSNKPPVMSNSKNLSWQLDKDHD